jgi:hypothetical protein
MVRLNHRKNDPGREYRALEGTATVNRPFEGKAGERSHATCSGRYSSNLTVARTPNVHFAFMNHGFQYDGVGHREV